MHYSNLLHKTALGLAMGGGVPWLWPTCQVVHFFGMVLLVGCVGVLDLRVLGVANALPIAPLQRLAAWGTAGFLINLVTGVAFYAGDPDKYQSWAFGAKMAFVLIAGLNVMLFYGSGLNHQVNSVGPGGTAPLPARIIAATSLVLWFGVIFWGRMLLSFTQSF